MSEKKIREEYEKILQTEIISQVKLNDETQTVEANGKRLSQLIEENSSIINILAWAMKLADNMNPSEKAVITNTLKSIGIKWKLEVETC